MPDVAVDGDVLFPAFDLAGVVAVNVHEFSQFSLAYIHSDSVDLDRVSETFPGLCAWRGGVAS